MTYNIMYVCIMCTKWIIGSVPLQKQEKNTDHFDWINYIFLLIYLLIVGPKTTKIFAFVAEIILKFQAVMIRKNHYNTLYFIAKGGGAL